MDEKKSFLEKMSKQVDEWDEQLEKLEKEMSDARAETKAEYKKGIADLQRKRDELQRKIKEFDSAADEAYADLKPSVEKHWKELKGALQGLTGSLLGQDKSKPREK